MPTPLEEDRKSLKSLQTTPSGRVRVGGGSSWTLCGFMYAMLLILISGFISSYVIAFTSFLPRFTVLGIAGVALVVVLAWLALMGVVCKITFFRAMSILTWMFMWTAIAGLIMVPIFMSELIGVLISGGIVANLCAIWIHNHPRVNTVPGLFLLP